jgi:hypothetical protein
MTRPIINPLLYFCENMTVNLNNVETNKIELKYCLQEINRLNYYSKYCMINRLVKNGIKICCINNDTECLNLFLSIIDFPIKFLVEECLKLSYYFLNDESIVIILNTIVNKESSTKYLVKYIEFLLEDGNIKLAQQCINIDRQSCISKLNIGRLITYCENKKKYKTLVYLSTLFCSGVEISASDNIKLEIISRTYDSKLKINTTDSASIIESYYNFILSCKNNKSKNFDRYYNEEKFGISDVNKIIQGIVVSIISANNSNAIYLMSKHFSLINSIGINYIMKCSYEFCNTEIINYFSSHFNKITICYDKLLIAALVSCKKNVIEDIRKINHITSADSNIKCKLFEIFYDYFLLGLHDQIIYVCTNLLNDDLPNLDWNKLLERSFESASLKCIELSIVLCSLFSHQNKLYERYIIERGYTNLYHIIDNTDDKINMMMISDNIDVNTSILLQYNNMIKTMSINRYESNLIETITTCNETAFFLYLRNGKNKFSKITSETFVNVLASIVGQNNYIMLVYFLIYFSDYVAVNIRKNKTIINKLASSSQMNTGINTRDPVQFLLKLLLI